MKTLKLYIGYEFEYVNLKEGDEYSESLICCNASNLDYNKVKEIKTISEFFDIFYENISILQHFSGKEMPDFNAKGIRISDEKYGDDIGFLDHAIKCPKDIKRHDCDDQIFIIEESPDYFDDEGISHAYGELNKHLKNMYFEYKKFAIDWFKNELLKEYSEEIEIIYEED